MATHTEQVAVGELGTESPVWYRLGLNAVVSSCSFLTKACILVLKSLIKSLNSVKCKHPLLLAKTDMVSLNTLSV